MPHTAESEKNPSQVPSPLELPLQIVPQEEVPPAKEDVTKERESIRGLLEGEEDLPWVQPPKTPDRGQA